MDQNLNNTMTVDLTEITIPMSLRDFAKRERFKVGFNLIIDTLAQLKSTVGSPDWSDLGNDDAKAIEGKLQAHIGTFDAIIKRIQEGENDE